MGTFILKGLNVNSRSGPWDGNIRIPDPFSDIPFPAPMSDADLAEVMGWVAFDHHTYIQNSVIGSACTVEFSCLGLTLYLDGSAIPIDTNNLPVGFTVTDANFHGDFLDISGVATEISFLRNGDVLGFADGTSGIVFQNYALGPLTNLQLVTSTLGVILTPDAGGYARVQELWIEGEYTTTAFPYTMTPASGDVEPGETIVISGPDVDSKTVGGLVEPDKVIPIPKKNDEIPVPLPPTEECEECLAECPECDTCYDACLEDFESENCQECLENCLSCLEDCLEDLEEAEKCQQSQQDDPPTEIVIVICDPRGTKFYGSVPLGTLNILVARASGIYRLVDGKTNDTLYATARDGTTYDVAIPTPFGKTGFFRS
ncbi:MAG: hypothetical protein ABWY25_00455 [Paenisporosarcina sp.]